MNTRTILLLAALGFLFSSCGRKQIIRKTAHGNEIYRQHIIEVDKEGKHLDRSLDGTVSELKQKEHFAAIIDGIDAHLKDTSIKAKNKKILLFFHGGLNSRKAAFERAMKNAPDIQNDSIYPVFVNWNSDGLSSYGQHLFSVSGGVKYKAVRGATFMVTLAGDLASTVTKLPTTLVNSTSYWNNFGTYEPGLNTSTWTPTRRSSLAIYDVLHSRMTSERSAFHVLWGADDRTRATKTADAVFLPLFPLRMIGLPIYDGLGTPAWVNMKRRATGLFHAPDEFDLRDHARDPVTLGRKLDELHTGVLASFLDTLSAYLQTRSGYEITIIGHSMGAIVANELLMQYPDLKVKNIVHMGAASSIDATSKAVIPLLAKDTAVRFYNLMLHPVAENRENFARHVAIPYGSLLVHIDNIFEQHASFIDRTSGRWENIIQATHIFPDSIRSRITLKSFRVKSSSKPMPKNFRKRSSAERVKVFAPQKHGQFDDDVYWLEAFWRVD